jgi:hypothetical protein
MKRYFMSHYQIISSIWAWVMRRLGYETGYVIRHWDRTQYLVRALRRPSE